MNPKHIKKNLLVKCKNVPLYYIREKLLCVDVQGGELKFCWLKGDDLWEHNFPLNVKQLHS